MLKNAFFEIIENNLSPGKMVSLIKLNPKHRIFEGHFPCNPVTPGVIQIQMVKELLEIFCKKELDMISMSRCKFLKILNPEEVPEITIHIEISDADGIININASGRDRESTYFKLSASFK